MCSRRPGITRGGRPARWARFVKNHAAAIASVAAGTLVFAGCMAATGGVGSIGCAAAAGAVGNLVSYGLSCAHSAHGCSVGGALVSAGVGALAGAAGGVLGEVAGAVGGMALRGLSGAFTDAGRSPECRHSLRGSLQGEPIVRCSVCQVLTAEVDDLAC
jgi:hypothetical protein